MTTTTTTLQDFNLSRMVFQDEAIVYIQGNRETGKTTLIRDILHHHQQMKIKCIIDPFVKYYNDLAAVIHQELNGDFCKEKSENTEKEIIVLDNCVHSYTDLNEMKKNNQNNLIVFSQAVPEFHLQYTEDSFYVFFFTAGYLNLNIKKMYDKLLGNEPTAISFDDFLAINQNLKQHECLVIRKTKDAPTLLYKYKAVAAAAAY